MSVLRWLFLILLLLGHAASAQATVPERVLAIYLPGVYFQQLERKLDLGSELATHLLKRLGEKYHLSARVYVSAESMDADAARISHGGRIGCPTELASDDTVAVYGPERRILALAECKDNKLAPTVVWAN